MTSISVISLQVSADNSQSEDIGAIESQIINKVIAAYGGDALINAAALKITDYNKGPWPGESEIPGVPEIWRINEELTIDYSTKRKSLLSYRVPRTTIDLEKWIHDGTTTIMYDILHNKYSVENWADFHRLGASVERSSDTLQARRLHYDVKEADYLGDEYYRGIPHQKLAVTLKSGAQFTYFVDKETGVIRKIRREHPNIDLLYIFANHQKVDDLLFAADLNFFVDGNLRLTSVKRALETNPDLELAFEGFKDYTPWGETIDRSMLRAEKLADGVYQAGKGRSMTVFIEQSGHFTAVGSADALSENFAAIAAFTDINKPINEFIVTHHHNANLRGLEQALELGAKLVVAASHKPSIMASLSGNWSDDDVIEITDRHAYSLGNIELYDIATAHAQHYLLVYLPAARMVIAEDHYVTDLKTAKPRVYHDMVRFARALDALALDVQSLIDIRGWRKFSLDEFKAWTQSFEIKGCPKNMHICANG
ncbi:hypothetical protein [Lacimicrobium sp. SS2-24]|uniref:hypothetical protein n=1 Tax=Lacimicrobium sp. SS2-24 TaxID=2005569 RepID=UPI001132340C|nr:hypothetical protein [Lacimicrobium sp. SS2-24]